ncbi:disulfide bond formation protein DsbB [Celerinatantimonas yamalensis]|uniref:Disulfide bond formation protein B n=1 Tax=Celerinatantimonas yamalensis TaxID=559956 RepID=A0ABW9G3H6_9GAMM
MFNLLKKWSYHRSPWLLLSFSALVFELAALYFQYGKQLVPCVMCIYERTAMLGVLLAGLVGAIGPTLFLARLISTMGFLASSSWGLVLAWQHVQIQLHPSPFAICSPFPHFPSWLPLNHWFPWMFQPHGDCAVIVWKLLNWSMPQWLIVAFAIYTIMALMILVSQFRR